MIPEGDYLDSLIKKIRIESLESKREENIKMKKNHAKSSWLKAGKFLLLCALVAISGAVSQTLAQQLQIETFSAEKIADGIIVGEISEETFLKMKITLPQRLDVFRQIRDKRKWKFTDEHLESIIKAMTSAEKPKEMTVSNLGGCSQFIEMENGSSWSAYPLYQTTPNSGECGGDSDDVVLVYNTPKWSSTNPDQVRVWSNLWWVRAAISGCYGGVSANGLCSSTTRACVGSCAKYLGGDLNYLYLWHK